MKRTATVLALTLAFTSTLLADVTVKGTASVKALGMTKTMPTTTYVKGLKMRTDTVTGDKTMTTIFDVENQKMYSFDNKKKEADVWDMAAFAEELSKTAETGEIKASIKPNGQTKLIRGKSAEGYDVSVTVPTTMGGGKGMAMTMNLTGHIWVVKGAPGTAEFTAFYKGAAEKGWIFGDPKASKAQPGQAKAMDKYFEQFASLNGMPYESDMEIKATGEGPMSFMAKAINVFTTSTAEFIETGALEASFFAPPSDYKLKTQK